MLRIEVVRPAKYSSCVARILGLLIPMGPLIMRYRPILVGESSRTQYYLSMEQVALCHVAMEPRLLMRVRRPFLGPLSGCNFWRGSQAQALTCCH